MFIGIVASALSNILTSLKSWFQFDDAMDVSQMFRTPLSRDYAYLVMSQIYACHGVAGVVGLVFTGVFAQCEKDKIFSNRM